MSAGPIAIRRQILRLIERFPGLHLRDLARRAGLSEALAGYHLQALEREGFVKSRFDEFYRRFYAVQAPAPTAQDEKLLGLLRQRVAAQISILLLEHEPMTQTTLTAKLSLAKSTISYHVGKLEAAGLLIVDGEGIRLREPDRVRRLLLAWRPPNDLTERFSDMWRKLYRSAR